MIRITGCILFTLALVGVALAQTKSITLPDDNRAAQLKPGPGAATTHDHCFICHSTDYIVRQPHLDAQQWEAEVHKMIKVYGAPVSEAEAKEITDYLARNYGAANPRGAK